MRMIRKKNKVQVLNFDDNVIKISKLDRTGGILFDAAIGDMAGHDKLILKR